MTSPVTGGAFNAGKYAGRYWKNRAGGNKLFIPEDPAAAAGSLSFYLACIRKYAPHWEQEFADIDRALGREPGTCLREHCFDAEPPPPHECTSWIVTPDVAGENKMFFHKNRDAGCRHLAVMQIAAPGKLSWIGLGNGNTFSPTMGINSAGVAIGMNSGDLTDDFNTAGFTTPDLARILLEDCATAADAVRLLEVMLRDGAYRHGNRGSIWFAADARQAFIAEHNATSFACHPVTTGIGLRANFWHYPEMVPHSRETPAKKLRQISRENNAYKILLDEGFLTAKKITLAHHRQAARSTEVYGDSRSLCAHTTNSAAHFAIDCEYPGILSAAWLACGPPRRAVFLPIPLVAGTLPDALLNGDFSETLFAEAREFTGHLFRPGELLASEVPVETLGSLDRKLEAVHSAAEAEAREILHRNGSPEEAAEVLNKAFAKNWATLARTLKQ